ncbi:amyloid-beta A4 precursor protein-binding family A member 1 [Oryzias melastigma]|uniref:Amyloid beta (A4) precursor protein-binding, family A, member 1b n=1 Tax=Oryzias melastigma TaxID=30732 RepID=A0A3B3DQ55_ORYME|nr:amyloid-beta A4 precursor protein-binding family A member 1 [Oryzias melastigma]
MSSSREYQEEATGGTDEEQYTASAPPKNRHQNGTAGEAPSRRSWRPCQMLHQDGEMNPHHHHHHHHRHHPPHHHTAGRGPPRHRRRPASGQSQGQIHSPGQEPQCVLPRSEGQGAEPRPVQLHRPAVTRYRRHGDPNPRLRGHRQRQQFREIQESSPSVDDREGPAEAQAKPCSSADPVVDLSQSRGSPQTLLSASPPQNVSADSGKDVQEPKVEHEDETEVKEDEGKPPCSAEQPSCSTSKAEEEAEREEEDQGDAMENAEEDPAAQGRELTDLCSDTESAASLSMDGPLHSPPPLHSPTPPSSPDVPPFPQLDHFSEDVSMTSQPDNDLLPEEEEDCSESCSLSHSTSCSESCPKSCSDEAQQASYPEPKSYPNSFPEPLKTSYPELQKEAHRPSGRRIEPSKAQQEKEPFTIHRLDNAPKVAPSSSSEGSHHIPRQSRDRGLHHSPADRSVGCRLHHYDGQSDGDEDAVDKSPLSKSGRQSPRQLQHKAKMSSPGQMGVCDTHNERSAVGLSGEATKAGDAISLAIKDIKEAIEGVKTKTVRSPYTPDQPMEPIWVMRQEVSPMEDAYPLQATTSHSSPHSPSQSESPCRFSSLPVRENVSPLRADPCRSVNPQHQQQHPIQSQQRDGGRAPQTYTSAAAKQVQQHHPAQQPQTARPQSPPQKASLPELRRPLPPFPTFVDLPGPCDPEDLIDGIIFAATYLGCTHLLSERTPTKSARMQQAQEAMSRVRAAHKQKSRKKSPDGEATTTAEVDLFMSTQRIKVLNADTQESLMDLPLRNISYIADIGNMVVLMARGKMVRSRSAQESLEQTDEQTSMSHDDRRLYRMICHVFESEDAQLIAQSIGQSFSVAYQEFLRANGIDPEDLSQREYSDLLNTQDMYNDDLIHFSKSENCRDVYIEKQKGEILGVVIVESGWGSILPTVIIASMMHAGPAEKSGRLNIGDQIMTINGTSLVGLPLSTCQSIIKGLKSQSRIKMNIVRCPPVTMVLIRRPDLRYQLGFSVQNGIICSLMRGGIAERGGVRVGHRIIEINSQSVVATPHEKIVQILSNAMGEIHMKTMPAAMYRLLTAQEQPVYI